MDNCMLPTVLSISYVLKTYLFSSLMNCANLLNYETLNKFSNHTLLLFLYIFECLLPSSHRLTVNTILYANTMIVYGRQIMYIFVLHLLNSDVLIKCVHCHYRPTL